MINDLYNINLPKKILKKIYDNIDHNIVLSLSINHQLVNDNIDLLKSYGIVNINELFSNKCEIFMLDTQNIVKKFSKFNIPVIVSLINKDINVIDEIFN